MGNIQNVNKVTELIAKRPISFVAGVFFCMFWATYFIHIRREEDKAQEWKELYIKEREEKDIFRKQLMEKAGLIERQQQTINEKDTILRNETSQQAKELLSQ